MRRSQYRKPYKIKKKKSLLKSRYFWRMVLGLIFAGEIFYIIYFFSYFQLKEIEITGNEKVKSGAIKNFIPPSSIFLVNSKKITENILKSFPQIEKVKVDRKFPAQLNLAVKERGGIANFCLPAEALARAGQNERCFSMDKEGIIFAPMVEEIKLLKIKKSAEDRPPLELKLGERVLEGNIVVSILSIESGLKDLKISVKEVLVVSDDRLNVKTAELWEIYFNPQNDLNWQITKLKAVLEKEISENRRKNLEYIDLRFGNLAPYKYR